MLNAVGPWFQGIAPADDASRRWEFNEKIAEERRRRQYGAGEREMHGVAFLIL